MANLVVAFAKTLARRFIRVCSFSRLLVHRFGTAETHGKAVTGFGFRGNMDIAAFVYELALAPNEWLERASRRLFGRRLLSVRFRLVGVGADRPRPTPQT